MIKYNAAVSQQPMARGTFSGYASVFHHVDQGRDIVVKGAFARSLKNRGAAGIKLLWQHNPQQPIGVIDEIKEDNHGLFIRGRLLFDLAQAREAYALLQAKAVDGLSIGYNTILSDRDNNTGIRRLLDVDLWEISIVTFPMQAAARIVDYKTSLDRTRWQSVLTRISDLRQSLETI